MFTSLLLCLLTQMQTETDIILSLFAWGITQTNRTVYIRERMTFWYNKCHIYDTSISHKYNSPLQNYPYSISPTARYKYNFFKCVILKIMVPTAIKIR